MKQVVVTGVLVKNSQDQYLLVKKPSGVGPYPNTYLTPGGGLQSNESVKDAGLRELFKETGVTVKNLKPLAFDEDITPNWKGETVHFIMLLYSADYLSGNLQPTAGDDDHLEVIDWFSPEQIKTLPLSPPLQKLFHRLGII